MSASRKPNIILIMADQLTPFMTGVYGNREVQTPNLDRLFREGVRFDAAYTPVPLCTPARAALMTGKYASRLGCWDNASPFSSEEPTIAHYCTLSGYETVLSGKMHFIGPDQLHGFERRLTTDFYPSSFNWLPERDPETSQVIGGGEHARMYRIPEVGIRPWSRGLSYDEETHFQALHYLRNRSRSVDGHERPLFLCVSYHHPHDPFHVTREMWDACTDAEVTIPDLSGNTRYPESVMDRWLNLGYHRTDLHDISAPQSLMALRRSYSALVTYIDTKVGELLKVLEEQELLENSMIIFTSDHGDMLGERGMVQKRCFYEWSSRIPLLVRMPGGSPERQRILEPVSLLDITPTLLQVLCGSAEGEQLAADMDGRSFLDLIDDQGNGAGGSADGTREVFAEYVGEGVLGHCAMLVGNGFKYVRVHGHDEQLFNLQDDPGELHNLAAQESCQAVRQAMAARVGQRFNADDIEMKVQESITGRAVVRDAMQISRTSWDYAPEYDTETQYHR